MIKKIKAADFSLWPTCWRSGLLAFGFVLLLGGGSNPAQAACSSPAGAAGEVIYNTNHSLMQYCDGTNWIAMGASPAGYLDESAMTTSGLIGHWKLNESSGTAAADSSGSGYNGTLTNMSPPADWVGGKLGNALDFDGTDDYVEVPDNDVFSPSVNDLSVSFWAKIPVGTTPKGNGGQGNVGAYPVAKGGNPSSWEWIVEFDNNQMFGVSLHEPSGSGRGGCAVTGLNLADGQWHHYAFALDNLNLLTVYRDGAFACKDTAPGVTTNGTHPVQIGRRGDGNFFEGALDDVRIYNRALTSDEVATLAGADLNTGLVGHWKLDESSGTAASDSAGSNNGTLTNGPVWGSGKINNGLSFDGVNDFVSTAAHLTTLTDTFTMAFWANPEKTRALTSEATSGISGNSNQSYAVFPVQGTVVFGAGHVGAGVSVGTNGISVFEHSNAYLPSLAVYNTTLTGWNHVVVVYNNKQPSIYLNGLLVRTGLTSTEIVHPSTWMSEYGSSGYGLYKGSLDDFRIYNRALSAGDATRLYCAGTPGKINYNLNNHVMQFCSGKGLYAMGPDKTGQTLNEAILLTGLVGYWNLNESSGTTAADSSGSGNNGTLTSGPVWSSGKINNGLSLDGVNDYVDLGHPAALNITSAFTLSAWVNASSAPTGSGVIAELYTGSGDLVQYELGFGVVGGSDSKAGIGFYDAGIWSAAADSVNVQTGVWVHIAGTWDGTTLIMYKNGTMVGTSSPGRTPQADTESFVIGRRHDAFGTPYFPGLIDDVRIYNRALTPGEIATLLAGSCASPTAPEGSLTYNADNNIMQYCNGKNWVGIGK